MVGVTCTGKPVSILLFRCNNGFRHFLVWYTINFKIKNSFFISLSEEKNVYLKFKTREKEF